MNNGLVNHTVSKRNSPRWWRWGCRRWWARVLRVPPPQRFAPASRRCRCRPPLSPRFVLLLLLLLLLLMLLLLLLLLLGRQPTYGMTGHRAKPPAAASRQLVADSPPRYSASHTATAQPKPFCAPSIWS
jgi:hypothetical protein